MIQRKPLVTDNYTADPSAKVFEGKIYIYPSHDRDIDPLIGRHQNGMIADCGTICLDKGSNIITLRLAAPVQVDMFRFAQMKLRRV